MLKRCADYRRRLLLIRCMTLQFYVGRQLDKPSPSVADLSWLTPDLRRYTQRPSLYHDRPIAPPDELVHGAIQALVDVWRETVEKTLFDKIPRDALPPSVPPRRSFFHPNCDHVNPVDIQRAVNACTTWFRCTEEGCLLDGERALVHRCAKTGPPINPDPQTDLDDLCNAYNIVLKEFPWNGDKILFDMDAHRAAQKIYRVIGPQHAQSEQPLPSDPRECHKMNIDVLRQRYVCGKCSRDGQICVMPWRVMVISHASIIGTSLTTVSDYLRWNTYRIRATATKMSRSPC